MLSILWIYKIKEHAILIAKRNSENLKRYFCRENLLKTLNTYFK